MTTIAVVAKDGLACIAADSLTSLGEMKLPGGLTEDRRKVAPALRPSFRNRREMFESWRKLRREPGKEKARS